MLGRHGEALLAFSGARDRARARGDVRGTASLILRLGTVLDKLGESLLPKKAVEYALLADHGLSHKTTGPCFAIDIALCVIGFRTL